MRSNSLTVVACSLLVTGAAPVEAAVVDYYLKFTGPDIIGSAADKAFKGASVITDFSWSIQVVPPALGGTRDPQITFSDFSWSQEIDTAVPALLGTLGSTINKAELHGVKLSEGKSFEFFTMTFSDVLLTNYQVQGSSDDWPGFDGAFTFSKLVLKVIPQKADGTAGDPVEGIFDDQGIKAPALVFAQLADFSAPVSAPASVPLPATLPLLVSGLAGLVTVGRARLLRSSNT